MSDLMLHGKLNMPLPDEPQDCDVVTWVQFKAAAKEAADRIEELEANALANRVAIMRLEAKLAKAVEFAEIVKRTGHGELEFLAWDMIAELKGEK
jgi:hypothetical protein